MSAVIKFYRVSDEFGCFSNFSPHPISLGGQLWPTSEHYFQAQKFEHRADRESIRVANSPMQAATLGRDRTKKLRDDWESLKLSIMREAVEAKFTQHADLYETLLATGDAKIVEHTKNDSFWGDGGDGRGLNWLGRILMDLREKLRAKV